MENVLCTLFGHVPNYGYGHWRGGGYFELKHSVIDGIGRVHMTAYSECERCGTRFQVGMIHLPTQEEFAELQKQGAR